MAEYLKMGEIALWANKDKQGKQPDVTGTIQFEDGRKGYVSLWKRSSDNPNAPAYSGEIQVKGTPQEAMAQESKDIEFDDEIPF